MGVLYFGWIWRSRSGSWRCWPIEKVSRETPIIAGVRRDHEDHGGEDADVDAEDIGDAGAEAEVLDDPEHRIAGEGGSQLGRVAAAGVQGDRHRREGDRRQQRVEADHGEDDQPAPRGIVRSGSIASSDMFEIVSMPV